MSTRYSTRYFHRVLGLQIFQETCAHATSTGHRQNGHAVYFLSYQQVLSTLSHHLISYLNISSSKFSTEFPFRLPRSQSTPPPLSLSGIGIKKIMTTSNPTAAEANYQNGAPKSLLTSPLTTALPETYL